MARRCLREVVWKLKTESNKKYEILKQESTCRMMRQAKQRIKLIGDGRPNRISTVYQLVRMK